jgi:hypothetical protein
MPSVKGTWFEVWVEARMAGAHTFSVFGAPHHPFMNASLDLFFVKQMVMNFGSVLMDQIFVDAPKIRVAISTM